jgi:hypothetical protein
MELKSNAASERAFMGTTVSPRFEIAPSDAAVQCLTPSSGGHCFEGLAFSPSGGTLGVAAINTNTVFLLRRQVDGGFDAAPHQYFVNAETSCPHDVSIARCGRTELLAVAKRIGVISIYAKRLSDDCYGAEPDFEIRGTQTRLNFSDGVAFVPPHNRYLAVNNLTDCTITFYRRSSLFPVIFDLEPAFELNHPSIVNPDGLNFSPCGRWLAIANHGNHSVSIFRRRNWLFKRDKLIYGPEPVQVIKAVELCYPHSVAFTPRTNHLAVTNSGANYFCVFAPKLELFSTRWTETPVLRQAFAPVDIFAKVNSDNEMEGGPKGITIHQSTIAVCSPELGIRMYSFREW